MTRADQRGPSSRRVIRPPTALRTWRMRSITATVLSVALLAACSSSGDASVDGTDLPGSVAAQDTSPAAPVTDPPPTSDAAEIAELVRPDPSIDPAECEDPPDRTTTCHLLTVPADWTGGHGGVITLPVIVLDATTPGAGLPVVIPGGGPGFTETPSAGYWATHPLRIDHDIVLYDQRGTGGADPSLECPERDEEAIDALQTAVEPPLDRLTISEAALVCRARLEAEGIDLDDYDTVASATDLDALRSALGYDQWSILGISYGSRLALESMRSFPDGLASVILDSVYDVTDGGLVATIASGERAFAAMDAANPGFDADLRAAQERFNASPWIGEVDIGDGPEQFAITGDDVVSGVFQAMYSTELLPVIPAIVAGLADGDTTIFPELLRESVGALLGAADGMQLSVDCADGASIEGGAAADDAAAESPGRFSLLAALRGPSCLDWEVEPTSATFDEPVISPIPALVLAGEFDPTTPPGGSEAAAARLPNATFVLFPGFGHGATGDDPCVTAIQLAFLTDPAAPPDTSCVGVSG